MDTIFSATRFHESLYQSSAIKYVSERKNLTEIFWSRAYERSVTIRKNRVKYIVRLNLVSPSPKVGHIQTVRCVEITIQTLLTIIFAWTDDVRYDQQILIITNTNRMYFFNFQLQRFSCNNSASNYFKEDSIFCLQNSANEKNSMEISTNNVVKDENSQGLHPSAASLVHHVLIPRNGWFKSINHRI